MLPRRGHCGLQARSKAVCYWEHNQVHTNKNSPDSTNVGIIPTSLLIIFLSPAGSEIALASGFQVCPYFIGHGIGSHFHCHPEIWHHGMLMSADALVCVTF